MATVLSSDGPARSEESATDPLATPGKALLAHVATLELEQVVLENVEDFLPLLDLVKQRVALALDLADARIEATHALAHLFQPFQFR